MLAGACVVDCPFETNGSKVAEHIERRTTLLFLISHAYNITTGRRCRISHHCGDTTFIDNADGTPITKEQALAVSKKVKEFIKNERCIIYQEVDKSTLVDYYKQKGLTDKADVAGRIDHKKILVAVLDDYIDYVFEPMKHDLSSLGQFNITATDDGFMTLQIAPPLKNTLQNTLCPEGIHKWAMNVRKQWEQKGILNITGLNNFIEKTPFQEVRSISESMSANILDSIIKQVISQLPERRVISIAGPSSSGKTTVSEPIKRRLEAQGYKCAIITTDDYFVDRADMIPNAEGKLEFESINAVLTDMLETRIEVLLSGGEIPFRKFDFHSGTGSDSKETFGVGKNGIIIIEGIHGVNPDLLCHLGKAKPQTIYVAPLTPISIDMEHIVSSSDICLARRIVRDNEERGYSPRLNVHWWSDVREGEEVNIAPFVKDAEMIYDSSFCYELSMMQPIASDILKSALKHGDDETQEDSKFRDGEIQRFMKIFSIVNPLVLQRVPSNPGIQEFLGSSLSKQ